MFGGLIALTVYEFKIVPGGFIPAQDKGYLITVVQLPDGASLERTDAVVREATKMIHGNARRELLRRLRGVLGSDAVQQPQRRCDFRGADSD